MEVLTGEKSLADDGIGFSHSASLKEFCCMIKRT
jgi:hypothetical protein